jgi:adenosylmethionine-8-amino-7-oxononanoate aminotransferase
MSIWYPYAQMKTMAPPFKVESAKGLKLTLSDGSELIDAISSWWCVIHGYSHPRLNQAAKKQIDKMSHVMLGGLTHDPAQELSKKLVEITPKSLQHVFFADSGSVGVEVSLKMALQYFINKGIKGKTQFCSLKLGYHGDTLNAMSVGDPEDAMHDIWQGALAKQFWVERPVAEQIDTALFDLETTLAQNHEKIAAFICEPMLQAWGGFNHYSADYLNQVRRLCDHYNVLLIFDEVATGFGRTGKLFATEHTSIEPDILVLSKALTGGYMGLSATIANDKVYDSFLSDDPEKCLMHGPTFMGNPLACAVAIESIKVFEEENYLSKIRKIESHLKLAFQDFTHSKIKSIRVFGACACIELNDSNDHKGFQKFASDRGVWMRPFNEFIYAMPAYITTEEELQKIINTMKDWFSHE